MYLGALVLLILGLYNLVRGLFTQENRRRYFLRFAIFAGIALVVGFFTPIPGFIKARKQGSVTACMSNLKNIGTACEMYCTDNEGRYPRSLSKLTPNYLKVIPECAERDTYSAAFEAVGEADDGKEKPGVRDNFTVYCQGNNHDSAGLPPDSPMYTALQGLIERSR